MSCKEEELYCLNYGSIWMVVAKETSVWIELQSLNQSKKPCFKVSQKSSQ